MRTLNVRLVGWLLLASLLIGASAWAFHGYQVRRNAAVLLREAAAAQDKNKLNQAADLLQRYLSLAPHGDIEPLAQLGELQVKLNRPWEAFRTFEGVLRQDPSRTVERRRLVEVALAIRRYADARHHLEVLLKDAETSIKDNPSDAELLAQFSELLSQLAYCQSAMNKPEQAAATYRRAIESAPEELENYAQLAGLLHGPLEQPLQALEVLEEMVNRNPGAAFAYAIRGTHWLEHAAKIEQLLERRLAADSGKTAEERKADEQHAELTIGNEPPLQRSLSDARMALRLDSEHENVLMFAMRCLIANGRADQAQELALKAVELFPGNPYPYASLAELERKRQDLPAAIVWLQRGLESIPRQRDLLWNLADLLIESNEIQDARSRLQQLEGMDFPRAPLAYLDAKAMVMEQQWFEASKKLEAVRAALLEWPDLTKQADFWLGRCYEQLGRSDLQLTAYRRSADVDARWIPARAGIAEALLATGKLEEAYEEFQQISMLHGIPPSLLAQWARVAILLNLRRNPSQRNWNVPTDAINKLEEADPNSTSVPLLRAELLVAQDQADEAETLLTKARDGSPESIELWLGLVSLAEFREEELKANQLLIEAQKEVGDSVLLRLAQARHLVLHRPEDARAKLRDLAVDVDAFGETETLELWSGLAGWMLALEDYDEAERLCTAVAKAQPKNLRIRLLLFDVAFRAGNLSTMKRVLEELDVIEHSGPLWRYGSALQLVLEARDKPQPRLYSEAKRHLLEAKLARPTWSRIPALLAHINEALGDDEAVIANLTEAIRLGERSPEIVGRAVILLYQRQRFLEADQIVRNLREQKSPFSTELTRLATQVSLRLNDREQVREFTKPAEEADEVDELLWAGRVRAALEDYPQAERNFRQAVQLDPTSAEAWVALIQFFGRTAQIQKAQAALAEAEEKIPPQDAPLALVEALESIEEFDKAEERYLAARRASPNDVALLRRLVDFWMRRDKSEQVRPLLEQVLSDEQSTDDDRIWGRRNLAVVLLTRPSEANLRDALELIEANLAMAGGKKRESLPDLRAKALVLKSRPDVASKREAAGILEEVLRAEGADVDGRGAESRFILAQLYAWLKDDARAIDHMRKLLAGSADHQRYSKYLAWYAEFLISRERAEISEAELWVNRLMKVAPRTWKTQELALEIRFARDQHEQLLAAVQTDLARFAGSFQERQERRRQTALKLEEFGRRLQQRARSEGADAGAKSAAAGAYLAAADKYLKAEEADQPQDVMARAAFYARNGRADEALDLLEQGYREARPEEIAAVAAGLVAGGSASAAHLSRLEQILAKSLEVHDHSLVLMLALADHFSWTGRLAEAERLYREALAKQPESLAALNNLAVLLALQGKRGGEALTLIEQAISLAGAQAVLLDSRGTVRLAMSDVENAVDDLQRAIALRPASGSYFRWAVAELQRGKLAAARTALQKATELGLSEESLHPLERPLLRQLQMACQ